MPRVKFRRDLVTHVTECIELNRPAIVARRSQALVVDMFCQGVQNINNYDPITGLLSLSSAAEENRFAGYNIMRDTLLRSKSLLLGSSPKREAKAENSDVFSTHRAKLHTILMDWAFQQFEIERKAGLVADGLLKSGNYVCSFFLDPTKGDVIGTTPDGRPQRTGVLTPIFDIADRWYWDTRARTRDEVKYADRVVVVPVEDAIRMFPDKTEQLRGLESHYQDEDILEHRVVNSTQMTNFGITSPRGKGRVTLIYHYEEPCEDYPDGYHAILAGSSSKPQITLVDYGFNPYGCIPAVLWVQDVSAYSLYGNGSFFNDLIQPQRELNKRANAELANADLTGNPRILNPIAGGASKNNFSNEFGEVIDYDPLTGPPSYMVPPPMPQYAIEARNFCLSMIQRLAPSSSMDVDEAKNASSGLHASFVAEEKNKSVLPLVTCWEQGWNDFWNMYVKLWKRLTIYPQQLRGISAEGKRIHATLDGHALGDDVRISVVPRSAMPVTRTGVFAEYLELVKAGVGQQQSLLKPEFEQRMLTDIGRGDMTLAWRDFGADRKNAERILAKILSGQQVVPVIQDNPMEVIAVIMDFMKSDEYYELLSTPQGPQYEFALTTAVSMFGAFQMAQMQQTAANQANLQAIGTPPQEEGRGPKKNAQAESARATSPASPVGGSEARMTKGIGHAANPIQNPGGNPG